ncbi:MAG: hypothetical protein QGD94_11515, partial [Planctomycetia bacterium]|nr:hypothetical protein [Planctomycetia bacterium]
MKDANNNSGIDKGPPAMIDVPCDYCGSEEREVLLEGRDRAHKLPGTFTVVRCTACGLAYTSPRPANPARYYPTDYSPHQRKKRGKASPWRRVKEACRRLVLVNYCGYPLGRPLP